MCELPQGGGIMGSGYHGGFGATSGARKQDIIAADANLVGSLNKGKDLAAAAKRVQKEDGFTDVAVHGAPDHIEVFRMIAGEEKGVVLNHRNLAKFLKADKGYVGGNIRLLSCSTGKETGTFAQNLANKMGVAVKAPSDTLHIWPNGKMVIGLSPFKNTGKWITYYPQKGKKV